ncbi:hypothetical protein MIND_01307500 [Mycena indigotica]|uniref:Uncharacterized protein n=1 Tax=Mycena indigotica TaxID=2126181 RepID=A0A8H6VQU9_9AGAR|nr:uncharacterized protein MIND_01307500 [Mycena indigotica]KAF7290672.1 hypothetical protein MIND_01307500 [Mycena indigotica]
MDNLTSVTAALDAGKLPTTQQLNVFIDWLTKSAIPSVEPSQDTLSGQGRVLARDIRGILEAYKTLGANKNNDNLLQEALWNLSQTEVDVAVDTPEQLVNKKEVSSDANAVRDSLRTIISIVWESISSEGGFLLSDFASFMRLTLADAAEALEGQAGRAKEGLRDVEQEVQDGKRDNLGRDKKRLEEEQDVKVAFEHGMDTLKGAGSTVIGTGQTLKQKAEATSDRTTSRLQDAYYKACERAQKDPAYHDSLSTLFDTVHKWVDKSFENTTNEPWSFDTLVIDESPDQRVHKALEAFKTLLNRLAEPKTSVDDVLQKAKNFSSAVRDDSVEVKTWVDKFFEHLRRSLDDPEYPRSQRARVVRHDLRQRGQYILDTESDAGRTWAELKETLRTFFAALASDEDIKRVRDAHIKFGEDVESGLVEASEEAETGVQAVLERAAWFWRDLFAVYAPRFLAMLKDIPIPRTEYVDNDMELVLENVDVSSFGLNPAHIFIRNITDVDVRTTEKAETFAGVGGFTHIRLQAVQLALRNVSFFYKDKTSSIPPNEFTGLLELTMPPQGIDIDIKVRLIPSAKEREAARAYHHIELLDVQISDSVELTVRESNHAIMLAIFKPIFNMRFREALAKALSEHLRMSLNWLGGVAWDVGRRAEVFKDAGAGSGTAFVGAVWSELGRLQRERRSGWKATGTGVVLAVPDCGPDQGGAKFAMGAEPQVLSGDKRGPLGTGSDSVQHKVDEAVSSVKGQVEDLGIDVKDAKKDGQDAAQQVKSQLHGLADEGKQQIRSFQRTVESEAAAERKNEGWKSAAFDF